MYKEYTARPWARLFLVLHPNIALSELAYVRATCFVKAKFNNWGRGKNVKFS